MKLTELTEHQRRVIEYLARAEKALVLHGTLKTVAGNLERKGLVNRLCLDRGIDLACTWTLTEAGRTIANRLRRQFE